MVYLLGILLSSCVALYGVVDKWFGEGIYNFVTWAFTQLIEYATLAAIKFVMLMIPFAWDVGSSILGDLNISGYINSAFGALPGDIAAMVSYLAIPQAVNIILGALATKFVLRFIPFL